MRDYIVIDIKLETMKNLLLIFALSAVVSLAHGQESLIAGIMQVEPVNLTIGEEDQAKVDEYDAAYEEGKAEMEAKLTEQSEEYAAGVTELVENFTEVMTEGEERMIKNAKQGVNTKANSLTFALIKDKKMTIQQFHNDMSREMRALPRPIQKMKEKDLNTFVEEQRAKIHEEFEANQRVLKAFKATEHIKKTHISDMPASDTSN